MANLGPLLIAVAALAAAVLLKRRASLATRGVPRPSPALPAAMGPLLGDTGLVAWREFHDRVRGRIFRIGTLLVLVAISLAIAMPAHTRPAHQIERVGVVGVVPPSARDAVLGIGRPAGTTVDLVDEPDLATARVALRAGRVGLVVTGNEVLVDKAPATTDTSSAAQFARAVATTLGVDRAANAAHLSASQAAHLANATPLPLRSLQAATDHTAQSISLIGLPLLFILFVIYNSWLLTGVMEEKSSRVTEVLLSTLRPIELLAGKVLGIGRVAVLQAGLIVATALGVAGAVGSDLLGGTTPLFIVATLAWLLLGYAFYCWVYAAAGSMAERRDQAQSLALPLTAPLTLGYVVALTAQTSGHASLLVQVLAYLPPTAPFAMPALVSLGDVAWWQFALSATISLTCTIAVARIAAIIYRRAVLRTGRRVHLRDVLARAGPAPATR